MNAFALTQRDNWPTWMRPRRVLGYASRLWKPSPFPMDVRWSWVCSGEDGYGFFARAKKLQACLTRDADGEPYFRLDGKKIYFMPDFDVPEADVRTGIEVVLRETYLAYDLEEPPVTLNRGDVVVDMGANVGSNTMTFADRVGPGGKVIAFEPVMHRPLSKNVRLAGYDNVVTVPAAVAEVAGRMRICVFGNCIDSRLTDAPAYAAHSSATATEQDQQTAAEAIHDQPDFANDGISRRPATKLDVEVTTLDDYVDAHNLDRLDLIKIDIEGAEERAMRGAERTVARFRPKWTISSYHTDYLGEPQHPKLVNLLCQWGYEVREYDGRRIMAW